MAHGELRRRCARRSASLPASAQLLIHIARPADALWAALDGHNQALSRVLLHLSELHALQPDLYVVVVRYLASLQSAQVRPSPFSALAAAC